jgi:hypothetical protein
MHALKMARDREIAHHVNTSPILNLGLRDKAGRGRSTDVAGWIFSHLSVFGAIT